MRDIALSQVFGRNVKSLRILKGWSQIELSKKMNLTQSAVSKIESGTYAFSADTLSTVASFFEIEPWALLKPDLNLALAEKASVQTPQPHLTDSGSALSAKDTGAIVTALMEASPETRQKVYAALFSEQSSGAQNEQFDLFKRFVEMYGMAGLQDFMKVESRIVRDSILRYAAIASGSAQVQTPSRPQQSESSVNRKGAKNR